MNLPFARLFALCLVVASVTAAALPAAAPARQAKAAKAAKRVGQQRVLASAQTPATSGGAASAQLTYPAAGASLSGVVALAASAGATGSRVAWVDFLVDGTVVGSDSVAPYGYRLDAARLAPGAHTLQVAAWDAALRKTVSAPVAVTSSS